MNLSKYLHESLLDDEEELINNDDILINKWVDMLGLYDAKSKRNLSANVVNHYYNDNGKIYTSTIDPNLLIKGAQPDVKRDYELKVEDILPEYLDFENITKLILGMNQTNYSCPDIMINKGLKKLSKYPIESLKLLYGNTKLDFLDFNLVGQNELKKLIIRMPRLGDDRYVDIIHWPKFKLDILWVESRQRPVILDNIKGLNCKNFICEGVRFDEKSFRELIINDQFSVRASLDKSEECIAVLDRFFQNNQVDNLIYLKRHNLVEHKYLVEKKGRGKGYKLTKMR